MWYLRHGKPGLYQWLNTLRLRQNGRRFADDTFKCLFFNENVIILIKISLKFVPKGPINNIPALVQIMASRHPGDKPLSEPMMISFRTHICITRPQWVNPSSPGRNPKMFSNIYISLLIFVIISCPFSLKLLYDGCQWIWVTIRSASGNGLVLSGNKPSLPEPMMTSFCDTISHD